MIIKFLTRKNIYSAKQLVRYVLTDKGKIENPFETAVFRNINRLDINTMHRDFLDNYKNYQRKRKNGTALIHEVIAIHKLDRPHVTKEMIQDLMESYIELRQAQNALCVMQVHANQHIHVMLSANEVRSKKLLRMSHQQMNQLVLDYEKRHALRHPMLQNSIVHTVKPERKRRDIAQEQRNKRREKEYRMQQDLPKGKQTQKEILYQKVSKFFDTSLSKDELIAQIQESEGLQIYSYRGVIKGIIANKKKKYKFTTLGIEKEKIQRLEKIQTRLEELQLIKETHTKKRKRSASRGRNS